jgi:hypothetical protein
MRPATTTSFEVSEVERAARPLPQVRYKQAVDSLIMPTVSRQGRRSIESLVARGFSLALPELPPHGPVEACARYHGWLLGGIEYHPVVAAVHRAFMDHRPLCLGPDAIWLMICQAVANHVNANAEELRPRLVAHEGKIPIVVRRDDFVKGSPENPWPEVFDAFSSKVREHVGPKIDLFLPTFSTTGPVERAVGGIVLLDAVQSYFQFIARSRCGIPAIQLEGATSDWQALADRADAFAEFGLKHWIGALRPILHQFVRASQGDVERPFWRSLYRLNDQSGGAVITGWITAFFPYLKGYQSSRADLRVDELFIGRCSLDEMLYPGEGRPRSGFAHGPTTCSLPSGMSKAPFVWEYLDRSFDMEFLGGFVGVAQDEETLALRPEIGWAVREVPVEYR